MAKEFKDFDKKFAALKGILMPYETDALMFEEPFRLAEAEKIDRWTLSVDKYTNAEIRHAVYHAEDAEDWQMFRVSLKGFTTKEKLYRLMFRLRYWEEAFQEETLLRNQLDLEKLRVDNYIGALVRGGQLNTKLEVVR